MSAKEVHRQPRASGWTEAEHPAWPRGTGCAPRAVRSAVEQGTPGTAQALAGPCAAHRALPPALPLPAGQGLRTPQSSARSSPSHSLPWPPLPAPSPRPSSASHPEWQGRTQRCRLSRVPGARRDRGPRKGPAPPHRLALGLSSRRTQPGGHTDQADPARGQAGPTPEGSAAAGAGGLPAHGERSARRAGQAWTRAVRKLLLWGQ